MASTPIYNWPTPDNTGLVKNGALDMRTLGNAIDTTMATMTPKSLVDAKGDLVTATANDTPARLAVGANGETLVADSSTSTGLRYTAGNPISNPIINSCFDIWQRGTSFTNGNANTIYGADRWHIFSTSSTGRTWSRQTTSDSTNLPFIQYCLRAARNSGDTQTNLIYITSDLETVNSIPYAGKSVTLSFYARAGANFSASSNALAVGLVSGTGTDQNSLNGFTGSTLPFNGSVTLTTTWQRFTINASIPSTSTQLGLQIGYVPTGTAGANDWFEITGVQIDIGSVALPIRRTGGSIQGELTACRRYLPAFVGANFLEYIGYAYSTNNTVFTVPFDVPARVAPTGVTTSGSIQVYALNTPTTVTPTFNSAGLTNGSVLAPVTITAGQGARIQFSSGSLVLFTGCEL